MGRVLKEQVFPMRGAEELEDCGFVFAVMFLCIVKHNSERLQQQWRLQNGAEE